MAQATLSAKINADIGDFSRNLDSAGRKWEKFGRDLNQGAASMSRTFGGATGSLSSLARGFDTAGRAAGLFAGLDGLAGIASSMTMGGPLLAGLAAVAAGVAYLGNTAEVNKDKVEKFTKSLDLFYTKGSDVVGTVAATKILQREYDMLDAKIKKIQDRWAGSMADPFGKAVINKLTGLDKLIAQRAETALEMTATGLKHAELTALGAKEGAKALADELERAARAAADMNKGAALEAWRLMQPGYIGGGVNKAGLLKSGQSLNDALLSAGGSRLNINDLDPKVREAADNLVAVTEDQTSVLESGFAQLPNALGSVLGSLLGPLFGSGRGAQIGGALGGAFGGGVGTMLGGMAGKAIGGALGAGIGSVVPIVGTALGGLLGGAIGGLFSHTKKHEEATINVIDALHRFDDALNQTTRTIINGVSGYRYNRAMYGATPQNGGPPPGGGITVNIANLAVQNARQFLRELGQLQLQTTSRGGSSPLQAALVEA